MFAGALADAMAFAHEGRAPGPAPPLWVGEVSDDTQLTLATCEALRRKHGEVHPEVVAEQLVAWHLGPGFAGLGASTRKALGELCAGGHWALVGRKGEMGAGNGAAIRVAPLAFVLDFNEQTDRRRLRDGCRITHHNDEAYVGALAIALVIQDALRRGWRGRESVFAMLEKELPDTRVRDRVMALGSIDSAEPIFQIAQTFGNSGYVVDSVPLAIVSYCWAAENRDFEGMVEQVVAAGGDCDSIGSMAGQCYGALVGEAGLPSSFVAQLPPVVGDVVDRLFAAL